MPARLLLFAMILTAASAVGVLPRAEGAIMSIPEVRSGSTDSGGMGGATASSSHSEDREDAPDPAGEFKALFRFGLPGSTGGGFGGSGPSGAGGAADCGELAFFPLALKPGFSSFLSVVDPLGVADPTQDGLLDPPRLSS